MNAITRLSDSASVIALGNVVAFPSPVEAPQHEPEVIAANEAAGSVLFEAEAAPALDKSPATALAERAKLTRAFEIVSNVIERRNTIPVLSNARLTGDGSNLYVTGTDLDIEIMVTIPAAADASFGLTLPAHTMRDLLKKATPSDFVGFTMPETGELDPDSRFWSPAVVDFKKVNYRLQAIPVSDYPDLSAGKPSHSFSLPGAAILDALGGVAMAISSEETRYYLNGVFLHYVEPRAIDRYNGDRGGIRFVATDGHRLCRQQLDAPEGCEGMPGIIIPRKTVGLLQKLLKGKACPESVKIELSSTKIRVIWDDVAITSKLIDGTFPDYQRVIPANNDKPATFKSAELSEGIRAVSLISSERARAVKLEFGSGNCPLLVNNPDSGSASAGIACGYDSDPLEIGFNASYVLDFIATADCEEITLTLADPGSPALITCQRAGWLGVLMPMRV